MPQISVNLAQRSYDIRIDRSLAPAIRCHVEALAADKRRCALSVDAALLAAQPEFVEAAFGDMPRHVLPSGEPTKCFAHLAQLCEFLAQNGIARDGVLFAFGGGVTGDLTGYAAASYLRGIDFVQVPTTLLSMVDSSVGGKTGINIAAGKNLVGAFWQPQAVFADTALLDTLPPREFSAGMGEIIKYGMLGDGELFKDLERLPRLNSKSQELPGIVARCCEIKARIVGDDERETAKNNGRALLNLGHTFAHAVENVAGYGTYLHGEAVGLGLLLATQLSVEMGLMHECHVERVGKLLLKYDLPLWLREPLKLSELEGAAKHDKKVRGGMLRYVVMNKLGEAKTQDGIDPELVSRLWKEVGAE